MLIPFNDEYFMQKAIAEAEIALEKGEVPIGAIVVSQNQIIGKGHNLTESLHDVTAHAEIQAITAAANFLGAKYLNGCTLYVTIEPCPMCAGALYWSQIGKIVFGARDEKRGAGKQKPSLYHPSTLVLNGIKEKECSDLIINFFQGRR